MDNDALTLRSSLQKQVQKKKNSLQRRRSRKDTNHKEVFKNSACQKICGLGSLIYGFWISFWLLFF